jgi:hypothetical protein
MPARSRAAALAGAVLLLAALDLVIARVDVFAWLEPSTRPTGFLTSITAQLIDVARALYGPPDRRHGVVVLGNSQTEAVVRPLAGLQGALAEAGVPEAPVTSLCVFGTMPTDAEVLTRRLGALAPRLVVVGLSPPDLGGTVEQARASPVAALFDVGLAVDLIPPANLEARLDRMVRGGWHLYRYRRLFRYLLLPPAGERRTPAEWLDQSQTLDVMLARAFGETKARNLLELRARFEASGDAAALGAYLEALRGPDYLPGLRRRWRDLAVQPIQLAALRRMVSDARRLGARPVWLLVPENPWLARDPEVGEIVRTRAVEAGAVVAALGEELDVPLVDLRHALPASAFIDLNHAIYNRGDLLAELARQLAPPVPGSPG